jgi:hypothetical protein
MNNLIKKIFIIFVGSVVFSYASLYAQAKSDDEKANTGEMSTVDVAKQLANPMAAVYNMPIQSDLDFGIGPDEDALHNVINFQPVLPFYLGHNVNLILRTIVPLVYAEDPIDAGLDNAVFGLGDILQSFFFGPADPVAGWIMGFGPSINYPATTDEAIGQAQFGAGPSFVILRQDIGWTYGLLANHIFGYCIHGDDQSLRNTSFIQPFINYTFKSATGITLNTETLYDWIDDTWTVPINLILCQTFRAGPMPMQVQVGCRYYAVSPENGPEWGLRFNVILMIPTNN